jgi:hypothetical protein
MATYYKYAERSADSQINWAEVGRDMSDMLKEETRIREEKKAAIDAASREFGQTLANPPQGEHKGANQWALEYADNASKFMLMQDRLLKSGQMKLKDYTVARQNILDGTDQAFNLTKEYQANFAEKMERYKTDKSQDLEQWLMAQAEGYSDFNKSQLYINPTDGTLSVAMKEKKIVDGKEVFVMNQNPNQFASVSTLRNQIAGKYDKFNTNSATDAFVNSLGEDVTSVIKQGASLTSGGLILNVEDIRKRTDLSEDGKQILYKFADSENQFIKSTLVNPFDRLSVLTNSKKFAPNGMQYGFTYDEAEAKGNPAKILLRRDPSSGQPTPQFSAEQMKVSEDFLRTELRAKYSRKEELKPTPQAQLQERRAPTPTEVGITEKKREAKNVAQNLVYALTGNPNESDAGTKYLSATTGFQFKKLKDGVLVIDDNGNPQTFKFKADGKTLADPTKFTKSFIGPIAKKLEINQDDVINQFSSLLPKGARINETTEATGFEETPIAAKVTITPDLFTVKSEKSTQRLQNMLPKGFVVNDISKGTIYNDVEVTAPNNIKYKYNANLSAEEIPAEQAALERFIKENSGAAKSAPKATTTTTVQGGNVRK